MTIKPLFGTRVMFSVADNSKKKLSDVFNQYAEESFEFSATEVTIRLYEKGVPTFMSRSQARRILFGLEKFKKIILDFDKVKAIGQGFADEIFRVWQTNHSGIKIITKNTDQNIDFMIKRAKNRDE